MDDNLVAFYREAFRDLPLHDFLGLRLRRIRGPVVVDLALTDQVRGLGHRLHGGAIATLVDVASAIAAFRAGRLEPESTVLRTAEVSIRYLAAPTGPKVSASAEVVEVTADRVTVECVVSDAAGDRVADARFVAVVRPAAEGTPCSAREDAVAG